MACKQKNNTPRKKHSVSVVSAVCIWRITLAVITTLLLNLSLKPALQAMQALQEMDDTFE